MVREEAKPGSRGGRMTTGESVKYRENLNQREQREQREQRDQHGGAKKRKRKK